MMDMLDDVISDDPELLGKFLILLSKMRKCTDIRQMRNYWQEFINLLDVAIARDDERIKAKLNG